MLEIGMELLNERYALSMERIAQIKQEQTAETAFADYFRRTAQFLLRMAKVRSELEEGKWQLRSMEELREQNRAMYEDILPEQYERSYANPEYALRMLGAEHGASLSFLYTQLRGVIAWIFEGLFEETVLHLELFLEVYQMFCQETPEKEQLQKVLYWFLSDNCDVLVTERVRQGVDPARDFAVRLICESDLNDLSYLYRYGEYVTENELGLAAYLNSLSEEEIEKIAVTYTEGYRTGFVKAGKDLAKKLTVNLRYPIGFERVVRRSIELFDRMGLRPVIYRYAQSAVNKRGASRQGYTGTDPNPQYGYDHREDAALFLDKRFVQRRLTVMRKAYDTFQTLANGHAGPAVIETFGEEPFAPVNKDAALKLSEKQQKLQVEMYNEIVQLTNRYIIGEERSFTIIAFPVPEIGPQFEQIFADTLRINTLDAALYGQIQQKLIDALDGGVYVHITGKGKNRTDLRVALQELKDPAHQTNFENCTADVNIPVGEVFTSPKLEGTNGVLHVTQVYLDGLDYRDLELTFRDGMITEYGCGNFDSAGEGRDYVRANVLFHHESLPLGEFAIGTNTAAYVMAGKYGIGALLPILIAEKTGPHFAVGDTCYSWEEELAVYNPDGKECIARDNSISLLRREDPGKAYFGCHTDITIPYSELGLIEVIDRQGNSVELIRDGRFVLPGTEELNVPLDG